MVCEGFLLAVHYGDPIIVSLKEECPVLSSNMNTRSCPTVFVSFGDERFSSQQANLDSKVVKKPSEKDDALNGGRDNCVRESVDRYKDPKPSSSSNVGIGFCVSSKNSDLKLVPVQCLSHGKEKLTPWRVISCKGATLN
ncbi:hypothetical protein ZIOFF_004506 [Zingiber officinale]|uniref:Uncharacterized protein n=1 Tax=Zingiber officinale TaxID=94328 RepID=A0A8J5HLA8_ZINOF|nr:hypothetical protein ZIOFF_004506 [Zingiber officinale]